MLCHPGTPGDGCGSIRLGVAARASTSDFPRDALSTAMPHTGRLIAATAALLAAVACTRAEATGGRETVNFDFAFRFQLDKAPPPGPPPPPPAPPSPPVPPAALPKRLATCQARPTQNTTGRSGLCGRTLLTPEGVLYRGGKSASKKKSRLLRHSSHGRREGPRGLTSAPKTTVSSALREQHELWHGLHQAAPRRPVRRLLRRVRAVRRVRGVGLGRGWRQMLLERQREGQEYGGPLVGQDAECRWPCCPSPPPRLCHATTSLV